MKYLTKYLWLLLAGLSSAGVYAQDFVWRDVVQEVTIRADGAVIVLDTRTLTTDEDFGEAFICLTPGTDSTVTLLEGGTRSPGPATTTLTQPCADNSGGTELVVRQEGRVDERRVFFRYRLDGSLDAYTDVVQWYWKILEQTHPRVEGYRLNVTAPGPMSSPYDAFVHRLGNSEVPQVELSPNRQTLSVRYDAIPEDTGVEIRYLMPPELFTVAGQEPGLESLLQDEARVAGLERLTAERRAELERVQRLPWWAVPVPLVVLPLAWRVLRVAGRRRAQAGTAPHYRFEPPTDRPPAAVTAFASRLSQGGGSAAFFATVMDLARRGYGTFDSQGKTFNMYLTDKDDTELLPFERDVLAYLKLAAAGKGDPNYLEFRELKRYSERHFSGFLGVWSKDVQRWLTGQLGGPRLEPASLRETGVLFALALVGTVTFAVGGASTLGFPQVALFVGAALCAGLGVAALGAVPAWRKEVAAEALGWAGFKRTLSDYTQMKGAPDDFFRLWEVYYPYAAALGVAEQFLKNMKRAAPEHPEGYTHAPLWLGSGNLNSLSDAASSLSTLSSALNSAGVSASSGGSSAGGGGGGGGGSSGGR